MTAIQASSAKSAALPHCPHGDVSACCKQDTNTRCAQELARSRDGLQYFLTYADNAAVGYFEKQGFSTQLTLPKEQVCTS